MTVGSVVMGHSADGTLDVFVESNTTVEGKDVFILQPPNFNNLNEDLTEIEVMICPTVDSSTMSQSTPAEELDMIGSVVECNSISG